MTAYQKYFKSILKKWKVSSPDEIPEDKKSSFFEEVDSGWTSKKEKVSAQQIQVVVAKVIGNQFNAKD